jgi:hypothetical protein
MTVTDDDRLEQAIRAYQVPAPPEGLAERVAGQVLAAAATPAARAAPRWRLVLGALGCVAAGAAAALGLAPGGGRESGAVVAGERRAAGRETVMLGGQAVAVLEPGAAVRWRPGPGRSLTVEQLRGDAFYRVEWGPFAVVTPGGTVNVRGTCFRVEIPDMKLTADKLKGAAAGAALASAVLVTVYEGRVTFANRAGEVAVAAGESALVQPEQAPVLRATGASGDEEAAALARATAALKRVPQLTPEAAPAQPVAPLPSPSAAELEWLPASLRRVILQVAQGREIENLKVRPHGRAGKRVYNLDFFVDGLNHELDVDGEGKVLTSEVDLPLEVLPEMITRSVQTANPSAQLVDAELNQNQDLPRYYEIHIRREGRLVELQVMEDGRIARELLDCPHQGR